MARLQSTFLQNPGMALPTVCCVCPHLSLTKKMPYRLPCSQILRHFLSQGSLLSYGPGLGQTDMKPASTQGKLAVATLPMILALYLFTDTRFKIWKVINV